MPDASFPDLPALAKHLRDELKAKKFVLLRENIDDLRASPKSLMPEGFEKQITEAELTNLLEFLTQRGKFLPLPLEKAATVVSTKGMFYSEDAPAERLIFADWTPKTFQGIPFQLVDPQGDVPTGFKQVPAVTREGRRMIGVRVNEDAFSIQFRDAGGTLYSFFKEELAEFATDDGRTAMPSFRDRLEPTALDDLVAYLVSLEGTR